MTLGRNHSRRWQRGGCGCGDLHLWIHLQRALIEWWANHNLHLSALTFVVVVVVGAVVRFGFFVLCVVSCRRACDGDG